MLNMLMMLVEILKNVALVLVLLWSILILAHIIFISYQKFYERLQEKKDKKEGEDTHAE